MQGRIAVVTGGARGIGRAIVDRFTAEGATVVIGDLTDPGEVGSGIDVAGRREWVPLDVTDETSVLEFAQSVEAGHGGVDVLVNTAGIMAERSITEGLAANGLHAAYATSKGGVHALTRALAVDLGPIGIRCNAIAPGWIDTDLNRSYVERHPDRDQVVADLARLHPIARIGEPADVAATAFWLASPDAGFVTGQVIQVEGGRTVRLSLPTALEP